MNYKSTIAFSSTIDKDVVKKTRQYVKKTGLTLSGFINNALINYMVESIETGEKITTSSRNKTVNINEKKSISCNLPKETYHMMHQYVKSSHIHISDMLTYAILKYIEEYNKMFNVLEAQNILIDRYRD